MPRSFVHNSTLGRQGETQAVEFLQRKGYRVLETNFRTPAGEIDIIAQDHEELVFVEVKTRSTDFFGSPSHAVNFRKKNHLRRVALHFMQLKKLDMDYRFDIVAILPDSIDHFENVTMF